MTSKRSFIVLLCASVLAMATAPLDPAIVPRNVLVSDISPGPKRGQATLILEWDRPTGLAPSEYQLGRQCAFDLVSPNRMTGSNSGLVQMTGPGPHYRVAATCNCNRGTVTLAVRVYQPSTGQWIYGQTVTGGNSTEAKALQADCAK